MNETSPSKSNASAVLDLLVGGLEKVNIHPRSLTARPREKKSRNDGFKHQSNNHGHLKIK